MSRGTSEAFFDAIELAAVQPWSSGKVGILGISFFAGSQWRVAALRPKGLAAIIPWEGMSDYYRDRCRHGGILSDGFIKFWWNRQVITNQYGRLGRNSSNWGPDTIKGDLSDEDRQPMRNDQTVDNSTNAWRDQPYYASKEYDLGNIEGWTYAGSKFKYLRFIVGRHDLPFYYREEVNVQRSFLDAFLKGEDHIGWSVPGQVPPVDMVIRKGNLGFNDPAKEKAFLRRTEIAESIPGTQYTKYHLSPEQSLTPQAPILDHPTKLSYPALGTLTSRQLLTFITSPMPDTTEVTGHVLARLSVSVTPTIGSATLPSDIDLFLILRHLSPSGHEVFYTSTAGDPVPLCKGWLRVSMRRTNPTHPRHRPYLPHRDYFQCDALPVLPGEVYPVDVELWSTNVVMEKGAKLVLEVASGDTQGSGIFAHMGVEDRTVERFAGWNHIHSGRGLENWVVLPVIPSEQEWAVES